jgi:hypothetical protein
LLMLVHHSNKEVWAAFVSAGVWGFACVSSMCACGSFFDSVWSDCIRGLWLV